MRTPPAAIIALWASFGVAFVGTVMTYATGDSRWFMFGALIGFGPWWLAALAAGLRTRRRRRARCAR